MKNKVINLPVRAAFRRPRSARALVVLDTKHVAQSCLALARAIEVSRDRGLELNALYVLRESERQGPFDAVAKRLFAPRSRRASRSFVRRGHATQLATEIARSIHARLIIVGAPRGSGGRWARVARRTKVPVLVARTRRRRGAVLAAVDFSDARFPVFEQARRAAFALGAGARLLLLHNVDPIGRVFTRGFGIALAPTGLRQLRDARAKKIHETAASVTGAAAVLSGDHDPVSAISEHANRLDADLVVVGAHAASKRRGPLGRTANRVVDSVGTSALIVPLPPRGLVA